MTSSIEGNVISAKVVGYIHGMFVKLRITKYAVSFRPHDVIFTHPSKKPELDFEHMKTASCSQRTS